MTRLAPDDDEFVRATPDIVDLDGDEPENSPGEDTPSENSAAAGGVAGSTWTDIVKRSAIDPIDLLPDADDLGLIEYLQQAPVAALPTVESTHQQVAGYVARLFDGRLLRYEDRWLAVASGGQGWEELTDAELHSIVRGVICRPDPDSQIPRRIIPVAMRKVTADDLDALVRLGIAELRSDGSGVEKAYYPGTDREVKKALIANYSWSERAGTAREIVSELAGRVGVVLKSGFDLNLYEIHCHGWILDLSRDMLSFSPRRATRRDLVQRSINADFDPGALCPCWRKFIREVTAGDTALARFLQKAAGLSLIGEIREQIAFILYGEHGNNGKSQFTDILLYVFGGYGTEISSSILQERDYEPHPTEYMPLRGARLVVTAETGTKTRWDVNKFKRLVTPGLFSARGIAKDTCHWLASHSLWATTNHRPRVGVAETAFFKRYMELPFTQRWYYDHERDAIKALSVGRVDPDLAAALQSEASGIFNWLLEGLAMYWEEGLSTPDAVLKANQAARGESSLWMEFLDEATIEDGDPKSRTDATPFYQGWRRYRQDNSDRSTEPPRNFTEFVKLVLDEYPSATYVKASPNGRTKAHFLGVELTHRGRVLAGLENSAGGDTRTPSNVTPIRPQTAEGAGA